MNADFNLKSALTVKNRLIGLWRLMTGYRLAYLAAVISLGIAAVSKTGTYLLLGNFADNILGQRKSLATPLDRIRLRRTGAA